MLRLGEHSYREARFNRHKGYDDYVPPGAITWRANLQKLKGEGQNRRGGTSKPPLRPGRLIILSHDRIIFHWEKCGQVEYRRDD